MQILETVVSIDVPIQPRIRGDKNMAHNNHLGLHWPCSPVGVNFGEHGAFFSSYLDAGKRRSIPYSIFDARMLLWSGRQLSIKTMWL
jgi:hypothetical protein